jgi:hypothetical protein
MKEMSVSRNGGLIAACGLLALVSVGCGDKGPKLYPATGTVTYEGKPLADASILFVPQGGRPSIGTTDASGKFSMTTNGKPGVPAGTYSVTISKSTAPAAAGGTGGAMTPPTASDTLSEEEMKKMQEQMSQMTQTMRQSKPAKSAIPARYSAPEGSGLSAPVTEDAAKNVFNFELTP